MHDVTEIRSRGHMQTDLLLAKANDINETIFGGLYSLVMVFGFPG